MENEKIFIKSIAEKVRKFYIGDTAMRIAEVLRDDCIREQTRWLVQQAGFANAYTALAYQCNYERDDSYEDIIDDMKMATRMQYTLLPEFVHEMLEYGQKDKSREECRNAFCDAAFQKAMTLISNDVRTANYEAAKREYDAEIPF